MIENRPQRPEIAGEELSVVLTGDFNPKIYQPAWFVSQGLLRGSEADSANIELIHTDFTSFSTDWFVMQVTRERFTLTVKSSAYRQHLRDLMLGTFHNLSHSPLAQMGLNYSTRLRFQNDQDWHCFGHFLLPKKPWAGLLTTPGLRSVAVEGRRPDDLSGFVIVSADPIPNMNNEVALRVNDHCERAKDDKSVGASFFLEVVERDYDKIMDRSKALLEDLVERYLEQKIFDDGISV